MPRESKGFLSHPMIETIGFAAAAIGALAFLPQVLKTWQTRSSGDLSTGMLFALTTGATLWVIYGFAIRSVPIVAGNAVTLSMSLSLLMLKRRCDDRPPERP